MSELQSDCLRHRALVGWLKGVFGLCIISFAASSYEVLRGIGHVGYPTRPGIIALVLFALAMAAITAAFRSLATTTSLNDQQRASWRKRLWIGGLLAVLPILVGFVGTGIAVYRGLFHGG